MIEVEIVAVIKEDSVLCDLSGVYPELLPQDVTYPVMTYQEVSLFDEYSYDGDGAVNKSRFQFDIYSDSYSEARKLSQELHRVLKDYTSENIASIRRLTRTDLGEIDGDFTVRRVSIDYYITHKEF